MGSSRRTSWRRAARSSMRSRRYAPAYGDGRSCSAPLWMSSSSRAMSSVAVTMSVVLRGLGRVRIGRRQVGEAVRGGPRRPVDAVADDGPVAGVDELGEEGVDHVVVERSPAAGLVGVATKGGQLDLEERALLDVGPGYVDDEEVGEHELGQR